MCVGAGKTQWVQCVDLCQTSTGGEASLATCSGYIEKPGLNEKTGPTIYLIERVSHWDIKNQHSSLFFSPAL